MFKTQKNVLITGYAAYVLYIFGFGVVFGPLEFSWAFYILAAMLGFAFYAMVSDYYPQTEAMEMTESPSDSARYIEDAPYARASICAILIFLLSITPLLITVSLNQRGIADISWFWQALIFLGGYVLQFVTTSIYKSCDSISVSGHVWYNDFSIRSASSTTTMKDVLDGLDEICSWAPSETVREAKGILKEVFIKTQNAYEHEIVNSARLSDDLGVCDLLEVSVILTEIDEILGKKYGKHLYDLVHADYESAEKRRFIEWDKRYSTAIMLSKSENKPIDSDGLYSEFISIFPKFLDLTHFLAEAIHSFRRR